MREDEKSVLNALSMIREQKARLLRFELGMCLEEDSVKLREVNEEILRTLETTSSTEKKKKQKKKKKSDKVEKQIESYTVEVIDLQKKLSELVKKLRLLRAFLSD